MEIIDFNKNWEYRDATSWWSPPDMTSIDLPHDFSVGTKRIPEAPGRNCVGYFDGGIIMYGKTFHVPDEWAEKVVILEFGGIYMNAVVKLNGDIIRKQPYGYTSFYVELNNRLKFGENNRIDVKVTNQTMNSRWYSGTGIYRPVRLFIAEKPYIKPWGVFITSDNISAASADLHIETTLVGADNDDIIRHTVYNAEDELIISGENVDLLKVKNPHLWDLDNPYLYSLKSEVIRRGKITDSNIIKFGIREINLTKENGFSLNGKHMKLRGGCVHHDHGPLGAASYRSAEARKVRLLKEAGFNAVRCAHNPPSTAFLDECDRQGLLVIDEIFDGWSEHKTPYDYGLHFDDWWERDFEAMLLRDRNHPSVIIWSTGNEVVERGGKSDGYLWAKRLVDFVHKYDTTRFTTNAANDIRGDLEGLAANVENISAKGEYGALTEQFFAPLDIAGYNYLHVRYEQDRELFPDRIICGLESFPLKVLENWEEINKLPNVIGDFVWTAIDYLGEAGVGHIWYNGETDFLGSYPWHISNCGDYDICGFKRPQSYYRDAVWGRTKTPYIAVYRPGIPHEKGNISRWGWQDVVSFWEFPSYEGKELDIEIYCSCEEVELFLNGTSLGRKPTEKHIAQFKVPYKEGQLTAISYNGGAEQERYTLRTPSEINEIVLTPESHDENDDLRYIRIGVCDKDKNPIHNTDSEVEITVMGADLAALGTGNPVSEESYKANCRRLYGGKALLIIKPHGNGEIKVTACIEGISTQLTI